MPGWFLFIGCTVHVEADPDPEGKNCVKFLFKLQSLNGKY